MRVSLPKGPLLPPTSNGKNFTCTPITENAPISPQEVLDNYSSFLLPYEIKEIQRFTKIYFLGYPSAKNQTINDSTYLYKINPKDHIAYRYEIVKILGSGSFGKVFQVIDHKTKKQRAIKIFVNQDEIKQQSEREANVLSLLNKHKCCNTVKGLDYFYFRLHACITFELLGNNLYIMQIKNDFRPFRQSVVKELAFQIFRGLLDCAKLGIVHCDIKPENICSTLDDSHKIKIVDFGSACMENFPLRSYIQSRYYRSPEVILRLKYGPKIDVWGAALIVIELLIGKHVFPGRNELEMLNMMVQLIGPIPKSVVNVAKKKRRTFFTENGTLKSSSSLPSKKPVSIQSLLGPNGSPQLIDFLENCLTWKASYRMSALQALEHPWLQQRSFKHVDSENLPTLMKYL